jgi:phage anti-repressor protein
MNELIKINQEENRQTVLGRDLHDFLEVATAYKDWFPRMCEYGFAEGVDFCSILSESTGGRPSTDHQITIEMAKELCMLQRTEKGKLARQYFIELEKQWNSPEAVMARALDLAHKKLDSLKVVNLQLIAKTKEQEKELTYKGNIIDGLCNNISIPEKRQILNQVVRHKGADYQARWTALYNHFNMTYHIDIDKRYKNYKTKYDSLNKSERKELGLIRIDSKLDYVEKELKLLNELYDIACKLYESDINDLVKQLFKLRAS